MEKATNLLLLSLYNLSNIKLIIIKINQGNKYENKWIYIYGQQSCRLNRNKYGEQNCLEINMDIKVVC